MFPSRSDLGRSVVDRRVPAPPEHGVALGALLAVPGVRYACAADGATGQRLDERGEDAGTALAVLEWGRRIASVSHARGRDLDDLMITSATAYHLLRPVPAGAAGTVWVYVRAARDGGNLAATRRVLAGLTSGVTAPAAPAGSVPVPRVTTPAAPAGSVPVPREPLSATPVAMAAAAPDRPGSPSGLRALPPAPRSSAPPTREEAPLALSWRNDLETLTRLLAGLRRLPVPLRGRGTAGDGAIRSLPPRPTGRAVP